MSKTNLAANKKIAPALIYTLDTDNPQTKYHGKFVQMMKEPRWYKAIARIHIYPDVDSDELSIVTVKHYSLYKTDITEYGKQLQVVINNIISEGAYAPGSSTVKVTIGDKPKT